MHDVFRLLRLYDVLFCAERKNLNNHVAVNCLRINNDRRTVLQRFQAFERIKAGDARHKNIEHDDVVFVFVVFGQKLRTGRIRAALKAFSLERGGQKTRDNGVVVNQPYGRFLRFVFVVVCFIEDCSSASSSAETRMLSEMRSGT